MRKRAKSEFLDDHFPPLAIISETSARTDFRAARAHAITLIGVHDDLTGAKAGRPQPRLEALKRSALILGVTAWESFVEDTVVEQLEARLEKAKSPADVSYAFNSVAHEWLDPSRSPKRHGPELARWTGDGWITLIRDSLSKALDTFHTPNSENTDSLFKRFLGISISKHWTWRASDYPGSCRELNELISLRGRVVHRGKRFWPFSLSSPQILYAQAEPDVRRDVVVRALNLVYLLMDTTERALKVSPTVTRWPEDILRSARKAKRRNV